MATAHGLIPRKSGKPHPDSWELDPHYAELFIDDGTGFVSGSDPTAEKVDATPVKVGHLHGITADAAERAATTSGQLTIARPGDYEIAASGDFALSGAADTFHIEVFKNGAVIADAAASPGGEASAKGVAVGTGAQGWAIAPFRLRGMVAGDTLDLRVTGTGSTTITIKQMRFSVKQVGDTDPASVVA